MRAMLLLTTLLFSQILFAESPLSPIKTESPRDTMRTFMDSMNGYRQGVKIQNRRMRRINMERAIRVLEIPTEAVIGGKERSKNAAVLLKEVIDRIIVINYKFIPDDMEKFGSTRWRLKDTEITIQKIESGHRKGEYLFSADTVSRARGFYDLVSDLPYLKGSGQGALYDSPALEKYVPVWARSKTLNMYHWQWFGILIGIFLGLVFKRFAQIVVKIGKKVSKKSKADLDDLIVEAIERPLGYIVATAIWFLCLTTIQIEGMPYDILSTAIQVVFSVSLVWFILNLTSVLTNHLKKLASRNDFPLDDQLVPLFQKALRLFIVIFGALISAQNLGINVMSLLAGLGLGGLAFALAAKDTAANFFGSVMILWDQPFKVGDWVKSTDAEGTVEEIGFRSTRIRTFYNSEISIPNSKLANENIDNMGALKDRTHYQEVYLTAKQKLDYIEKVILPQPYKNSTLEDRTAVFKLMEETVAALAPKFTFREFIHLLDFYLCDRDHIDIHLRELLPGDTIVVTLLECLRRNPKSVGDAQTEFCDLTKRSARNFYDIKRRILDGPIIKLKPEINEGENHESE